MPEPIPEQWYADALKNPVLFASRMLQDETWETLSAFQAAVLTHNRIAIRGCHSSSKTFGSAQLVLWWLARYKDGVAVTIAPGARQVDGLVWLEIRKAKTRSLIPFPDITGTAKSGGIRLDMTLGNYAIGFSTEKGGEGVRAHGIHAPNLLIIIDEAPGVSAEVLDALEGMAAGGHAVIVMLGNPTIPGGPFYDAFTKAREVWKTFTIDAFDTPNFKMLRDMAAEVGKDKEYVTTLLNQLPAEHPAIQYSPRSYLVQPLWAKERLLAWGEHSPRWESRVRGKFPTQSEDSLLSLAWLEAAKVREVPDETTGPLKVGLDVAAAGKDETVAIVRQGPNIIAQWSSAANEMVAWNECVRFLSQYKQRIEEINIDSAGVGAGFAKQLEELGYPVNRVNVGEATNDPEHFFMLKAELFWGLRQRFKDGDVNGLTDETLISQLATLRYKINERGQVVIESKDDLKKRGVSSPDRAEALMLAFANRTPGLLEYMRQLVENQAQPSTDAGRQVVNVQERRTEVILPEGPKPDAKKPVELPNLMDLYNSALTGGKPAIVCKGCGLAMGKHEPQVTDGIDHWHPSCAVKKY